MSTPADVPAKPDHPLSEAQMRFFDAFGYLHLPGLIRDRIEVVTQDFEAMWRSHGGGHNGQVHDGVNRSCRARFVDEHEGLSLLLDDPRIHGAAVSLLGEDFNYMGSDGNLYAGDTVWHIDGDAPVHRHIKISFYLDALDAGTGALRVIPGSHHVANPMRRTLVALSRADGFFPEDVFSIPGASLPSVAIPTEPGDVVVFNHNLFHSAWRGGPRRRMFTMNLSQRFPPAAVGTLQAHLCASARFLVDGSIGPAMQRVATPRMRRHLEQVLANDGLLAERARALRAAGAVPARA